MSKQAQDSCRAQVTVNVLTLTLNRVTPSKHLQIRCFWSPAPALVVPCSPMPVVTSVIFACPQERTERKAAEKQDRAEEDRKKAEAAHRKQADEEQQLKVTSNSCAIRVFQFCAYISSSFLSD